LQCPKENPNLCNNLFKHIVFTIAKEIAIYFASIENIAIGFFFACPTHDSIHKQKIEPRNVVAHMFPTQNCILKLGESTL
jgi:hypothetical protein